MSSVLNECNAEFHIVSKQILHQFFQNTFEESAAKVPFQLKSKNIHTQDNLCVVCVRVSLCTIV